MFAYFDASIAKLKHFEGCVPWMYRDTVGKVTVGVGRMLPNAAAACALPFQVAGVRASAAQIAAEFARVDALAMGKGPEFYRTADSPQLPPEEIDALLTTVLTEFESALRAKMAGYDAFPDCVKLALLDMAYNLGTAGLLKGYPHLIHSVEIGAWADAAAACGRHGPSPERNTWTQQQFLAALNPGGIVSTIRAQAVAMEDAAEGLMSRARRKIQELARAKR